MRGRFLGLAVALFLFIPAAPTAQAQYFGRNKVQWEKFDFKTLQTQHFDIYYYDREEDVVNDIGRQAERWYERFSGLFNHTFTRKPIVLYANSADFHQTTTTGGLIGEGTGGFTDAFMNRVVLPLTGDYAENDHVLGHEIVHVFQYDIAASATRNRRRFNLEALPLWLIEGMAEYFSKGRVDPLTAMWIRDATIQDRLPDLRKLSRDPRYFPYRYGQALMAYLGARFGDDAVVRYFVAAGVVGIDEAFERAVGVPSKQLFLDWHEAARELYNPVLDPRTAQPGTLLLSKKNTRADLNVGPAYSPDGRFIAFLSTRELFSIDLFLADAKTGRVLRRLVSTDRDAHFESLRFIDSGGGWSPDSRRLAFVTFAKGDNFLSIVDVETRKTEHIPVPGVAALTNPAWSNDGRSIAFSGQTTGVSDLFIYDLESKQVRRLTSDRYADLQPAWSPDGRTIVFVTDRGPETSLDQLRFAQKHLATIDVATGRIRDLRIFENAKHINPQWAPDGNNIYFIANPEGIPDIYRYTVSDGSVARVTHVQTGVAGITDMSPAMSVAAGTGEIAFSVFEDDNHNIYTLPASPPMQSVSLAPAPDVPRGALLPPLRATGSEITAYLESPEQGLPSANAIFRRRDYNPSLHVAYVGPPSLGVAAGEFGFGAGGSISAYFTDILGQHNVGFAVQGGGSSYGGGTSFADQIGAQVFYLNQQRRFNWGAQALHIPYVSAGTRFGQEIIEIDGQQVLADIYEQVREIQTIDDVTGLAQYPFSTTRRIEGAAGFQRYGYKAEVETFVVVGNTIIDQFRERLPGSFSLNLWKASGAFVGDSSIFGFVSPVRGTRYRYEIETLQGDLQFQTALADWRRYFFFRPVTLAVRGLHYGRYGAGSEDTRLAPIYVGQPSLVRGYDPFSIGIEECVSPEGIDCPVFDRLNGSKIAIGSIEFRLPLLGTKEFGVVNAPFLPTELMAFADVGAAWRRNEDVVWKFETDTNERVPVVSVGLGARILLSYIPIEIYAAKPFQRPTEDIVYGFNIIPGW